MTEDLMDFDDSGPQFHDSKPITEETFKRLIKQSVDTLDEDVVEVVVPIEGNQYRYVEYRTKEGVLLEDVEVVDPATGLLVDVDMEVNPSPVDMAIHVWN